MRLRCCTSRPALRLLASRGPHRRTSLVIGQGAEPERKRAEHTNTCATDEQEASDEAAA
jgi:hypothetical protein